LKKKSYWTVTPETTGNHTSTTEITEPLSNIIKEVDHKVDDLSTRMNEIYEQLRDNSTLNNPPPLSSTATPLPVNRNTATANDDLYNGII